MDLTPAQRQLVDDFHYYTKKYGKMLITAGLTGKLQLVNIVSINPLRAVPVKLSTGKYTIDSRIADNLDSKGYIRYVDKNYNILDGTLTTVSGQSVGGIIVKDYRK